MTSSNRRPLSQRPQRITPSAIEILEGRRLLSTGSPAYLVPAAPGVETTPLLTVGDSVGGYRMVGIPDGLGAFDNGDGTFTVLMNHELSPTNGIARDHGAKGAFVSRWIIDKESKQVLSGDDLIKQVYLWNPGINGYEAATTALNRLCSANLPEPGAFYNPATGLGTTSRIFMNGEETSNGRAFAHVVTGPEAGKSYNLPWTGLYAYENNVASPYAQDKTIVVGLDDSRREFSSEGAAEPSEVYVWVGNKKATGSEIEKAGLGPDGVLYGLRVGLPGSYDANEGTVASGERFELVGLSNQTNNTSFAPLQAESLAKTITQFRRVEDGHFDPTNPNVFYFVTTDQFGGSTRLWKLTFDDITNPEAGGVIEIAVDSPAGVPGEMFDNITTNPNGDVLLQEDPGGNPYLAKVWQWDASSRDLTLVAEHNPALFGVPAGDLYPDIPGVQGTNDEESSGIIDLSQILGPGYYLADVQAHYSFTTTTDPTGELVQGGQLLLINTAVARASLSNGVLSVDGTINDDQIVISRHGQSVSVEVNGQKLDTFSKKDISAVVVRGYAGDDSVSISPNLSARAILIGGQGSDALHGTSGEDILIGDDVSLTDAELASAITTWAGRGNFAARRDSLDSAFDGKIVEDSDVDLLNGGGSRNWLFNEGGEDVD